MVAEMRVLVVEDDAKIASFVVNGLKQSGFAVDRCGDGLEGLARAETVAYDAAVVDVMLPKMDGLKLVQKLRAAGSRTPVLFLSAKASVDDRVSGLQAGGDDYLTKPFAFAELLARVQALVRRATRSPEPTTLTVDDLVMDLLSRRVTRRSETHRRVDADFVPYQLPVKPSHHDERAARLPCGRVDAVGDAHSEISDSVSQIMYLFPTGAGGSFCAGGAAGTLGIGGGKTGEGTCGFSVVCCGPGCFSGAGNDIGAGRFTEVGISTSPSIRTVDPA